MRIAIALLVALLVAGCAGTTGQRAAPSGAPATERAGGGAGPPERTGRVRHELDNRAVALLWAEAESARRADRLGAAVTALERALRLAPEDPVLWSRLAELRLRQRDFAVAENLAAKSNALAGEERLLRYRNWLIIAEARRRRGDTAGAGEAQRQADELQGPS